MNLSSVFLKTNILRNAIVSLVQRRGFVVSPSLQLKEIIERKEGKTLVVEGVNVPSVREPHLLKVNEHTGACPICRAGVDVKHTDVLILSQFVRQDGCMLPRRITGLCRKQQKRVSTMVTMAQKAGLMPNLAPANSKRDPRKRREWKKFNTYFDESTIRA
ncbi:28S ribosomal protein S18a, mitochondrial [Ischnura elegans]|uniref:28S ribosomal protein S18a, mitochondrial n=1 Tax=Ischnura elegans TaxID=197161 RepID=UPI001ED89181|nr:28S ribosomal protein S18a, mitochondrial [Ischnura elegans]